MPPTYGQDREQGDRDSENGVLDEMRLDVKKCAKAVATPYANEFAQEANPRNTQGRTQVEDCRSWSDLRSDRSRAAERPGFSGKPAGPSPLQLNSFLDSSIAVNY